MDSREHLSELTQRLGAAVTSAEQRVANARVDYGIERSEYAAVNSPMPDLTRSEEVSQDLLEINRDLERFIGTVTHDLRSPLRAVVGTSKILLDDYAANLPEEAKDLLRRQVTAGIKMSSLIDDLVEYTKLGQAPSERFDFDFSKMAKDLSYELLERSWPNQVQFDIAPAIRVKAFPGLVRAILQALLENAVKFSMAKGPVRVEVGKIVGPTDNIYFVRDNGPGFEQSQSAAIFEPFMRICPTELPGNGIGLANVRKAVLCHKGRVWAESTPTQGATFFFTLGD